MTKKQKNKYLDETPLDSYEKELNKFIEKGEFVSDTNFRENKKMFEEAAKRFLDLQKTKRISLRVKKEDILKIYVEKMFGKGHSLQEITDNLLKAGWPKAKVDEAIKAVKLNKESKKT